MALIGITDISVPLDQRPVALGGQQVELRACLHGDLSGFDISGFENICILVGLGGFGEILYGPNACRGGIKGISAVFDAGNFAVYTGNGDHGITVQFRNLLSAGCIRVYGKAVAVYCGGIVIRQCRRADGQQAQHHYKCQYFSDKAAFVEHYWFPPHDL